MKEFYFIIILIIFLLYCTNLYIEKEWFKEHFVASPDCSNPTTNADIISCCDGNTTYSTANPSKCCLYSTTYKNNNSDAQCSSGNITSYCSGVTPSDGQKFIDCCNDSTFSGNNTSKCCLYSTTYKNNNSATQCSSANIASYCKNVTPSSGQKFIDCCNDSTFSGNNVTQCCLYSTSYNSANSANCTTSINNYCTDTKILNRYDNCCNNSTFSANHVTECCLESSGYNERNSANCASINEKNFNKNVVGNVVQSISGETCITGNGEYGYIVIMGNGSKSCMTNSEINNMIGKYNQYKTTSDFAAIPKPKNTTDCMATSNLSAFDTACKNVFIPNPDGTLSSNKYNSAESIIKSSSCPSDQAYAVCSTKKKTGCQSDTNSWSFFNDLCNSTYSGGYRAVELNNSTCPSGQTAAMCSDSMPMTGCLAPDSDFQSSCEAVNTAPCDAAGNICGLVKTVSKDSTGTSCSGNQLAAVCAPHYVNGMYMDPNSVVTDCYPINYDFNTLCKNIYPSDKLPVHQTISNVGYYRLLPGSSGNCKTNGKYNNQMARAICSPNYIDGVNKFNNNMMTSCMLMDKNFNQECKNITGDASAFASEIMGYDCLPGYMKGKCLSGQEINDDKSYVTMNEQNWNDFRRSIKATYI